MKKRKGGRRGFSTLNRRSKNGKGGEEKKRKDEG